MILRQFKTLVLEVANDHTRSAYPPQCVLVFKGEGAQWLCGLPERIAAFFEMKDIIHPDTNMKLCLKLLMKMMEHLN